MNSERIGHRRPFCRQALPHNFRDLLGKEYGPVRRVSLVEMVQLLQSDTPAEPNRIRTSLPLWAVVSKSTGAGWHCTTAVDVESGAVYTFTSRVGMSVLFRGIARARPGTVLYLERADQLRADGSVYKCLQPQPVKKQRPMQPPDAAQVADLTGR